MKITTFKQFGTFSVIILLPLMLIFIGLLIKSGFSSGPIAIIQMFVIVTFLICLLIFYQLTITIDNNTISFKLGIGFVGKTYKFSDIKSCKAVTNSVLNGVGIRMLSNGWLYNVSGLKAIELQFKNRRSIVRIGTDKPEEIADIVNTLIKAETVSKNEIIEKKRQFNPMWIVVIILFLLPIALLISSKQEANIYADQKGLIIEGTYGLAIAYDNLIQVDTINSLPQIKIRTNGYALGKTKIGNFRLSDYSNVKLYVKSGFPPYILIHAKDNKPIYINFEDRMKTINLYNELKKNKK